MLVWYFSCSSFYPVWGFPSLLVTLQNSSMIVMTMGSPPEVLAVMIQQQQTLILLLPPQIVGQEWSWRRLSLTFKQVTHGRRAWTRLLCSAVWNRWAPQFQQAFKQAFKQHYPSCVKSFPAKCYLQLEASLHPRGAPKCNKTGDVTCRHVNSLNTDATSIK